MGTEAETEGELLPPTAAPSQANLATSFCLSLASKSPGHRERIPATLEKWLVRVGAGSRAEWGQVRHGVNSR